MPRKRRTTSNDVLANAQTARTEGRLAWFDFFLDRLIVVWPDKKNELELVRIDLHAANPVYTEILNDADRAVIDRVSVIVGNETLDREQADRDLADRLAALERSA